VFGEQFQAHAGRLPIAIQDPDAASVDVDKEACCVENLSAENHIEPLPQKSSPHVLKINDRHGLIGERQPQGRKLHARDHASLERSIAGT